MITPFEVEKLKQILSQGDLAVFALLVKLVLAVCGTALVVSIIINFIEGSRRPGTVKEKKSVVDTLTMSLFFGGYLILLQSGWGSLSSILPVACNIGMIILGLSLVILGTVVNIRGRLNLGHNWANQIKLYKDQGLVTTGMYSKVRHPLYASLIWLAYGLAIIFSNPVALVVNTLIFVTFMYYRAKQEEKLLGEKFPEYADYQKKVGMFLPKFKLFKSKSL